MAGFADNTVRLFDVPTGRELDRAAGHTAAVIAVAVSADGTLAASGSDDKTARVWLLPRRIVDGRARNGPRRVSPDGPTGAARDAGAARLRIVPSGQAGPGPHLPLDGGQRRPSRSK